MKLLSVICIGFVLLFACKEDRNVEVGAQTSMVFKSTVYNAGTVYKGEVIRAVFEVENMKLIKRITLILNDNMIVKYFYPIFPPDKNVEQVIKFLTNK